MTLTRSLGAPVLACAIWLSSGCGSAPFPVRAQTDAVASARVARELGAANTPEAAYHLALADDQLRQAQELIREGRVESAERVFERAKVDADLAAALQREAQVRAYAASTRAQIEEVRRDAHEMDGR